MYLEKDLREAAVELNTVLGLKDPAIDPKAPMTELVETVKEAVGLIEGDVFELDASKRVIHEIRPELYPELDASPETNPEDLRQSIEDAQKLSDLKEIAKTNDVFKETRGKLSSFKTADALKSELLMVLDDLVTATEPVVAEKKVLQRAKPAAAATPATDKPKGKKPEKAGEPGKPGIIATIVTLIEKSGKKGITKEAILEELKEAFPDRDEKSMKNTINVQVPARINKEKWPVEKLEGGLYRKA
jgi:hypothetical protein